MSLEVVCRPKGLIECEYSTPHTLLARRSTVPFHQLGIYVGAGPEHFMELWMLLLSIIVVVVVVVAVVAFVVVCSFIVNTPLSDPSLHFTRSCCFGGRDDDDDTTSQP